MSFSALSIVAVVLVAVAMLVVGVVLIMLCSSEKATENVEANKEEGKVTLNLLVRNARIFAKQDAVGKGDPYVVLNFNGEKKKTVVLKDTLEPEWNEEFSFPNAPLDSAEGIKIELWDEDSTEDQLVGTSVITDLNQYAEFADGKRHDHTLMIIDEKQVQVAELDVEVWAALDHSEGGESEQSEQSESEGGSENEEETNVESKSTQASEAEELAKITLKIVGAQIHRQHDEGSKDDTFVQLKVGDVTRKTATAINSQSPTWNDTFTFEKVSPENAEKVLVQIYESDADKTTLIGSANLALLEFKDRSEPARITLALIDDVGKEEALVEIEATVEINGANTNSAVTTRDLSTESESAPKTTRTSTTHHTSQTHHTSRTQHTEASHHTSRTQHTEASHRTHHTHQTKATNATKSSHHSRSGEGNITIAIVSAKIHKVHDVGSKDDTYVQVKVGDITKKTHTVVNSQNPVYNEAFSFEKVKNADADSIEVQLYESDLTGSTLIGSSQLSVLESQARRDPAHVSLSLADDQRIEQAVLEIDLTFNKKVGGDGGAAGAGAVTQRSSATHKTSSTHGGGHHGTHRGHHDDDNAKSTVTNRSTVTEKSQSKSPHTSRTDASKSKSPTTSRTARTNTKKASDTYTEYGRNDQTEVTVILDGTRKKKAVPKGDLGVDNTNTEILAFLVNEGRKEDKKKRFAEDL